ncbi:MAG: radical SAM protein [bacterium]
MRVQRVVTNETCNQNCWYCNARRPAEDPEYVAREAVRQRITDAIAQEAREIVLTGGEPTLRRDLADLVRRAAAGGAAVALETNGALINAARAEALAAAGLTTARVQLTGWGDAADAITRDPGGHARAVDGIRALGAAGVTVEVTTPIVRRNVDAVAALPREIGAARLPVAELILVIPTRAPDGEECAPLADVAAAVVAVADAARRTGLGVRMDAASFVPPCIFSQPERITHLYALNRGHSSRPEFARVEACATCLVNDRCPGFPEAALTRPLPPLHPIADHRIRRRMTFVSSVAEQVAREFVVHDILRNSRFGQVAEYTIRINFHCNQSCEFCFVSTHLPSPPDAEIRATIEKAGREHAMVVFSGGEPTLNPRLLDYIHLAREQGVWGVELQTNATRVVERGLAQPLAAAGLDQAMVSLHGSTAELSDTVTGAPGTHAATVGGIDALVDAGVRVRLNFVFCQANHDDFPRFVDYVAARWPRAAIVFSFVGSHTDVVPRTQALIPSFSQIMPFLFEGLGRAHAAGLEVCGFDSMCGMPLCLVPEAERREFSTFSVSDSDGNGEFVKGDACRQCAERHRCYGVRRGYAELYGTGELRALGEPGAALAAP